MKKTVLAVALIGIFAFSLFAVDQLDKEKKREAIKKVILGAYIEGLFNKGDLDVTRKGFHPDFNLLGNRNNKLTKFPIKQWIASTEKRNQKDPTPLKENEKTTCKFVFVDITGDAAVAKIDLFAKGEKHIYTDYLFLYEFEEGWRIVSKIYHAHTH